MGDFEIRELAESEYRAATNMFHASLLSVPLDDEGWERARHSYQPGRALGAVEGDTVVGLARSADSEILVPGGRQVPLAAVQSVGVRADRTRRGVATSLVHTQLAEFAERGVPLAALHASEAMIYGRYGYGPATQARTFRVDRRRAQPMAPQAGRIELYELDEARRILPEIYASFAAHRVGMISRPPYLWPGWEGYYRSHSSDWLMRLAVYHGPDGVQGYAAYHASDPWPSPGDALLTVDDMVATTGEAFRGLWLYLLSIDLVDKIVALGRPVDEPIEPMLTDSRTVSTDHLEDDLWLRLVDVPAALQARAFAGTESLVMEVRDPVLPANEGRYRIGPSGTERTDETPGVTMDVDALGMLYLGGWRPSALERAGRITATSAEALRAADALFQTRETPWCGTFF